MNVFELKVKVQNYDWGQLGERSKITQLLKSNDADYIIDNSIAYAELWMGTHPNGESLIKSNSESLSKWISRTYSTDGQLSFLFKVLSINKALSIQCHPNKEEAQKLYCSRPDIYKDPNHKPELAIALTEFKAMCGFRSYTEIQRYLRNIPELQYIIGRSCTEAFLETPSSDTLKSCFEALMNADNTKLKKCFEDIETTFSTDCSNMNFHRELFFDLKKQFPNDVGVLCIYFLNVLHLQPGEAIYLGPNIPHAYIQGDCIECMACSDNVIRAGLTPKYKDVETLVRILDYKGYNANELLFKSDKISEYMEVFKPPIPDFAVVKIQITPGTQDIVKCSFDTHSIVIVISGRAESNIGHLNEGMILFIGKNEEFYIENVISNNDFIMYQAMSN